MDMWASRCELEYPYYKHDIPPPNSISIRNCVQAANAIDTCNQAYAFRRILDREIEESCNTSIAIQPEGDKGKNDF